MAHSDMAQPADRRWISSLTMTLFRNHPRTELQAGPGPVALYGRNGAGKTNILEAVSQLSPGRGLRGAKAEEIAKRPEAIGWRVRAVVEGGAETTEIDVAVDLRAPGAKRQVTVDDAPQSHASLGETLRQLWLTPAMDRLWIEGASERRRFLDRVTLAFDPGHGERAAAYERAMRERNRLLKDDVFEPSWLDALEARMAHAGAGMIAARGGVVDALSEAQNRAESLFPKADIDILDTDGKTVPRLPAEADQVAAEEALRIELRSDRRRDAAAGRTLRGPHRHDLQAIYGAKGVEARLCSTGEQKALLIRLVLAAARALSERLGRPPLLLLDEVAAHLDQGRRAALYDEICALGAQAWMTGTEPGLFEALDGRATRYRLDADGQAARDDG